MKTKLERFDGTREDGLILRFTGEIYNRPGQGINLVQDTAMAALEAQFDEGYYEAEIVIRRKGARENFLKGTNE